MERLYDILLPGPWWHPLTYRGQAGIHKGARVRVPVGKGERTGVVVDSRDFDVFETTDGDFRYRKLHNVLEEFSLVSKELIQTLDLSGKHFLCGAGELLKIAFPAPFFEGRSFDAGEEAPPSREAFEVGFERNASYEKRMTRYRDLVSTGRKGTALVVFPERKRAEGFWKSLSADVRKTGLLWPLGNAKRAWEAWKAARSGEIGLVVGSPVACFAPLAAIELVIVEDEGNPAFYSRRYPHLHGRSILTYRARYWKAELLLGGAIPSSRSYLFWKGKCLDSAKERIVFAERGQAREIEVRGVKQPLPVNETILKRTQEHTGAGSVVLWLLDRIGYASGIWCRECTEIMECRKCGTALRWEAAGLRAFCPFCGSSETLPETCPKCRSAFIEGIRPGIEASSILATNLLGDGALVHEWHGSLSQEKTRRKKLVKSLSQSGGVVIGSRRALELCDELQVTLTCWLDVDMELLKPFYDAKYKAFRMVWESLWRGANPERRTVVIQTRKPRTGWQRALEAGWHLFWEAELSERHDLDLPPWKFLIEARAGGGMKKELFSALSAEGFECLDPEPEKGFFWIRTEKTEKLRKALIPFFSVSRSKQGYPRFKVWID